MPNLRNGSKGGFEPGLTRLRVRHSTAEPLVSPLNQAFREPCFMSAKMWYVFQLTD